MLPLLSLGHCRLAHGLKGGFVFELYNSETQSKKTTSLHLGLTLHLFPLSEKSSLTASGKTYTLNFLSLGNKVIGSFEGIPDRTAGEKLLPFEFRIPRSELPSGTLESGEYYVADLLNLPVFEHGSGRRIGQVKGFYDNGAQVVLVIAQEDVGKGEIDLPFLDCFFPVVDLGEGRIEMRPPEYLE